MRRFILVAVGLFAAGLSSSFAGAQARMVVGRDTLTVALKPLPSQLTPAQARAIAPRVGSLSVTPNVVRLRVGDTLAFDTLVVAALDSSGHVLGYLRGADLHLRHGLVQPLLASARLVALIPGVADLELMFPRVYWEARSDAPPMVDARIEIGPAAASETPATRDFFCPRDVDSTITIVSQDYAGYAEVRDRRTRELTDLVAAIRRDGLAAPNPAACSSVLAHFLDFFHDRRLTVVSQDAMGRAQGGPHYANRLPSVRYLDDSTALITLPEA